MIAGATRRKITYQYPDNGSSYTARIRQIPEDVFGYREGGMVVLSLQELPIQSGSSTADPESNPMLEEMIRGARGMHVSWYYREESSTLIVDQGKEAFRYGTPYIDPFEDIDEDYRRIVLDLIYGSRELVAEEVVSLLRTDDPDTPRIKIVSLQSLARFLLQEERWPDPIVGPDPYGIMQAEWHILGDGLLVMAFVEPDTIHCVAQADATEGRDAINTSMRLETGKAIEEFCYLVPERPTLPNTQSWRSASRFRQREQALQPRLL